MFSIAILISMAIIFVRTIIMPGMLFSKIGKAIYSWPTWLKKPFFICIVCMVPWYGAMIYFLLLQKSSLAEYVCSILIAGGVNSIIDQYLTYE